MPSNKKSFQNSTPGIAPILLLVFVFLSGCGLRQSDETKPSAKALADTAVYRDGIGREVELPKRPLRIVSLAPSVTETIYLLGAQDRLIGTRHSAPAGSGKTGTQDGHAPESELRDYPCSPT